MSTFHIDRGRAPSHAVQALHRAGFTGSQVAAHMGIGQQSVAAMFTGRQVATPALLEALVAVAGEEVGRDVYALCPDRRDPDDRFGLVTRLLHAHGRSVSEVAANLDVSRAAVHLWLSGRTTAPPALRDLLGEWLDEDADAAIAAVPRWRDDLRHDRTVLS